MAVHSLTRFLAFFHAYARSSLRHCCKAKSATTKTAMDRGQLQAFSRATLLGLVLLSMVTWVPHGFSCLRGFLLASLPPAASGIVTPKQCLFFFSNAIVVFLATESKRSRSGARSLHGGEHDGVDAAAREELAVFAAPSIKGNLAAQEGDDSLVDNDVDGRRMRDEDEVLLEEATTGEDCEEEATELPTVDELNRRVEDFIARFNMERQLEARMVVCC